MEVKIEAFNPRSFTFSSLEVSKDELKFFKIWLTKKFGKRFDRFLSEKEFETLYRKVLSNEYVVLCFYQNDKEEKYTLQADDELIKAHRFLWDPRLKHSFFQVNWIKEKITELAHMISNLNQFRTEFPIEYLLFEKELEILKFNRNQIQTVIQNVKKEINAICNLEIDAMTNDDIMSLLKSPHMTNKNLKSFLFEIKNLENQLMRLNEKIDELESTKIDIESIKIKLLKQNQTKTKKLCP